jgi:hypothetical protein
MDPLSQVGDLAMQVGWSQDYGSWYWTCIYGCHGTDCESTYEAEQALLKHTCYSAGEVCS